MTVDELIQAADNGDVQAMITVADALFGHYKYESFAKALDESLPWYERAAQSGSAYGAIKTITGSGVFVLADKEIGNWDDIIKRSNTIINYSNMILNHPDATPQMKEEAVNSAEAAYYDLACGLYHRDKNEEAIAILQTAGTAKGNCRMDTILRGLCYDTDFNEMYDWIHVLEGNSKKLLENNDDKENQVILSIAFNYLALIYREEKGNTDKAYEVLAEGVATITHPKLRSSLQEELNHYRKKMFGGYQYIK